MSVIRHHADWLSLIESSGPFVSLPVLMRVFPQGLEPRDPAQAKALRAAYEEWNDNPSGPGKQRAWLLYVLTAVLGYPQDQITEGKSLPAGLEANMPEMGEILRPDFALVGPSGCDAAGQAQLLIASYPLDQVLDRPVIGKHWKATPATRMMELLHGAGVSLGLITNGEQWMLVYAPRGETTGFTTWYGTLWLDEPITLRSFHSLLGVRRFFGVATDSTLVSLLKESAQDQQEVTDQLGYQVREAVEVLVQSFDAINRESGRTLLIGVTETSLYEAALTIMMRLVFLFSAEERGLLHLGKPLYDDNYAVSTLQEQLQEVADRYGEEVLERRLDAWSRLLATFRAVHGGIQHQDLLMQAYGGSLFDPDRYPLLEGRSAGTAWHATSAEPLAVNNRVVLHLLNSLQRLRTKVGAGATTETRRVSFRALGVEQIGHVYEGLLDHTAVRATEPVIGIKGTRTKEPEIPLSTLEEKLTDGQDKLIEFLKDETGRSVSAIRKALDEGGLLDEHKLLVACDQDEQLVMRLRSFAGIIREDSFERPLVVLTGSVYVTAGTDRRSSGTHYTPPSLTEPIVHHTLEPLVYEGPAEGLSREQWKLKSPKAILNLKVCDMAMGSGAFLVQSCRYLAERLVEAWESEEKLHPGEILITPDGKFSEGSPKERLVPVDLNERIAIARRVVADRCLYGVDINPMAVEMAKLSLWLITVDANRPFTFLDHAFKCGDSLLGISSIEQLENFSMRFGGVKQLGFATLNLQQHIEEAKKKREALEDMQSDTPDQIAAKAALYAEAEVAVTKLNVAADVLVGLELKGLKGRAYESERETSATNLIRSWSMGQQEQKTFARGCLAGRRCLHWALAFPEILMRGGFDAIVGNPPFLGGKRIGATLGKDYSFHLTEIFHGTSRNADLCAFFFRRAYSLLQLKGDLAFLATNTISEGETRDAGLKMILAEGGVITHAESSFRWPGTANVQAAMVQIRKTDWKGRILLDGIEVEGVTHYLEEGLPFKDPFELKDRPAESYIGSVPYGDGFILTSNEAKSMISENDSNASIVKPYINGDDINGMPPSQFERWIIDFGVLPEEEASPFTLPFLHLDENVKPFRFNQDPKEYSQMIEYWWQYWRPRRELYQAISGKNRIIVLALTSKYIAPTFVPPNMVYDQTLICIPSESSFLFGVLQSWLHVNWAIQFGGTMGLTLRYNPSRCFQTFPFPFYTQKISDIGEVYWCDRRDWMESHNVGLTDFYNSFHDKEISDFSSLREVQQRLDEAVKESYGWTDLSLDHGFHETKQGIRFTISEVARRDVLERLLSLNHQRHADEEIDRLTKVTKVTAKRGKKKISDDQMTMDLS